MEGTDAKLDGLRHSSDERFQEINQRIETLTHNLQVGCSLECWGCRPS